MSNTGDSGPLGAASLHTYISNQQGISLSSAAASSKILEAQVVVRDSKENPGQKEKGIVVDGKFYQVDLPPDIKEGDKINVKFSQDALTGKQSILFLGKAVEQQSIASQENQKVSSELLKLLNKLNLNSQIISQLKDFTLQEFKANVTPGGETVESKSMLVLEKFNLLTEKKLFEPKQILDSLKKYDFQKIKEELQVAREALKSNPNISFEQREKIENLRSNLKTLIRDLDLLNKATATVVKETPQIDKNEVVRRAVDIKQLQAKPIPKDPEQFKQAFAAFEKALEKMNLEGLALNKNEKPVSRLFALLNVVAERDVADSEQKLESLTNVVKQQIVDLKTFETTVKKLLISPSSETQIDTLIRVLDGIDVEIKASDTELQKEFKLLVLDLKKILTDFSEQKLQPLELKLYLMKVLDKLYKDFGLEPLESRVTKDLIQKEIEQLKPEQVKMLKLIEAQIKIILNSPKDVMMKEVLDMLKTFNESSETLLPGKPTPQIFKEVAELIKKLENYQSGKGNIQAADKEIQQALKVFQGLITKEISETPEVFEKYKQQAVLVSSLVKELLSSEDLQLVGDKPDLKLLAKIVSSPAFKSLMEILKRNDQSIPTPNDPIEHALVEFSGKLIDDIERDLKYAPQKLGDTLRKAVERLDAKLTSQNAKEEMSGLAGLSTAAFKGLESIVTGQETLQKLNPMLQKAGEPIMLLFPFFIHGMLSKLEVSLGKRKVDKEEERRKKKGGYQVVQDEHLRFEISLPNLGKVIVDLLRTDSGVMAKFNVQDSNKAEKIKPYLQSLEQQFKEKGYDNVFFSVISEKVEKDWFSDSLQKVL